MCVMTLGDLLRGVIGNQVITCPSKKRINAELFIDGSDNSTKGKNQTDGIYFDHLFEGDV